MFNDESSTLLNNKCHTMSACFRNSETRLSSTGFDFLPHETVLPYSSVYSRQGSSTGKISRCSIISCFAPRVEPRIQKIRTLFRIALGNIISLKLVTSYSLHHDVPTFASNRNVHDNSSMDLHGRYEY